MKNFMTKAVSLALCLAMLFSVCVFVSAENVDEAWDVGENYVFYGTYLAAEGGEYEMSELYDYTLFAYMPEETGKYTFTVENGLCAIVSYTGMWVSIMPDETTVTESTIEWECTGVGQEIWLAVITDDATASVRIESGASERVVVEYITYENKTAPSPFTFPGDPALIKNVNVRNTTVDQAVLGEDGYYHLNSADGYILYANLSDSQMNLSAAASYGQLKGSVYNENGELVAIDDYNEAFNQYFECADAETFLYPLTEDLITMIKEVGANQNWYGADGWLSLSKDDAWMFCCYYTEESFEEEILKGDIDGDGRVTSMDSNRLSRIIAGVINVRPDSNEAKRADINGDGYVNAIDSNVLKRLLVGIG